eukprot:scaffold515_cov339-Pavlova_lutheri.AAC.7
MSTSAEFHFAKGACKIVCPNEIIETVPTEYQVFALSSTAQKWHDRLGHASAPRLKLLGLPHKVEGPCEPRIQAKQTAQPFHPSNYNHEPVDLIYTDLVGPVPETPGGQTYYLSMYDQASKASQVFLLPKKSSARGALMEGINTFEKIAKKGYKVKAIRSDFGGEFQSSQLQNFMKDRGITHETTAGCTPQQNAAKRLHRTLHDSARECSSVQSYRRVCGEKLCAVQKGRTPLEILTGSTPNLHRLRAFGCDAWVLIPPEKRKNKFSARSVVGTFIGYQNSSTYRILVDNKVTLSRNVTFFEDKFSGQSVNEKQSLESPQIVPDLLPEPPQFSQASTGSLDIVPVPQDSGGTTAGSRRTIHQDGANSEDSAIGSKHGIARPSAPSPAAPPTVYEPPVEVDGSAKAATQVAREAASPLPTGVTLDPKETAQQETHDHPAATEPAPTHAYNLRPRKGTATRAKATRQWDLDDSFSGYARAMARPDADLWKEAITDELTALAKNGLWRLVPLPPGRTPLTTTWVFKVKTDGDGQVERYKARLCVRGFEQRAGVDFHEVFAPASGKVVQRAFLTYAALMDYEVQQVDINTDFLNAELNEDIYIRIPEGLRDERELNKEPNLVLKLENPLYGLKQAPRM